jgi:hypothetical protein
VVIGGGELMEILMLSQQDSDVEVFAVLDRRPTRNAYRGFWWRGRSTNCPNSTRR